MSAKKPERKKHIPQRTCVACRQILPKRQMIRIVKSQDGVKIDQTGKAQGRGAYMHDIRACWMHGIKGSLAKALKTELTENELADLIAYMNTLKAYSLDETAASEDKAL